MKTRPQIAGVIVVAALITLAATGIGFAAPSDTTQAVTGPSDTVQQQQAQVQIQQQECTFPANGTYESFDVSDLSAPSTVEPGETVTVTADISNPNDAPLIQCVEFRLEGDVVERRGWALNPNETETITFEVDTTGLEEGTYIHGVETRDMGELTTLTVSSEPTETPNETTETPTETPNETTETPTATPTETPNETTETPTETPTGETDASIQFDDQSSDGSEVSVSSVTLSEGGFIAITDENGTVLGASGYLVPGDRANIVITLSEPLTESTTLTAVAHQDTNDNQQLDFLTSDGAEDGPYTDDGTPITDDAEVSVEAEEPTTDEPTTDEPTTEEPTTEEPNETTTEEPPAEEPTASVVFEDQNTSGIAVLIDSATLSEGGFLVVHDESGAVLGASGYLEPGDQQNVAVTLDEPLTEDATLTAMPHVDSNGDEQFDFVTSGGDDDGPYTDDDGPVTDDANVTLESEA